MPERIVRAFRKTRPRGFTTLQWLSLIAGVIIGVLSASAWSFWPQIREAAMDPRTPFQTAEPFAAPDYSKAEAWALRTASDQPVDIFFVHPTTYEGRRWNAGIDNKDAADRLKATRPDLTVDLESGFGEARPAPSVADGVNR